MRKIFLLLFIVSLVSCKSDEDKVKDAVKKFIKETMHDPSSYESVYFSSLDTLSWKELNSETYDLRNSLIKSQSDPEKIDMINRMEVMYNEGNKKSYRVTHHFRGKNAFGATVVNEKVFRTFYIGDKIYSTIEE